MPFMAGTVERVNGSDAAPPRRPRMFQLILPSTVWKRVLI